MSELLLLDRGGRRRSPATMPGFHTGRPPRNKGFRYPADPPKIEEIIAVMRTAGDDAHGRRLRGLIVVLWRAGLRIQEALALAEGDLDHGRGALLVRRGKGGTSPRGRHGRVGLGRAPAMVELRVEPPVGPLFCVLNGRTRGRQWSSAGAGTELRRTAVAGGVRRRFAPHQLRHAHAVEMAHEGVPLVVIQRQLGHSNLGITSVYLQGIDNAEIINTVNARRAPMIPVSTALPALTDTRPRRCSSRIAIASRREESPMDDASLRAAYLTELARERIATHRESHREGRSDNRAKRRSRSSFRRAGSGIAARPATSE